MGDSPAEGEPSSSFAAAYERHRGSVKWYNNTKGYGFVTPEGGGEDLFVHQSNINAPGYRSLREGEPVEYDVEPGLDGRQKAINVTGPGGVAPQGAPPKPRPAGYPQQGGLSRSGRGGRNGAGRGMGGPGPGPPGPPAQSGRGYYSYPVQPVYFTHYYYPGVEFADPSGRGGRGRGGRLMPMGGPPSPTLGAPMPSMSPQHVMYPPHVMVGGASPGMGAPMQPLPSEQSSGLQVVVHNLPWTCTWQQLKDCFREWKVERADIVEDQWGRSRGFGTVRFSTQEDAMAACAKMNNTQIDSRTISVRIDRFA
ncbi:putative nucleic acid binding protein [Haematococcus lacustris]